MPAIKFFIVDVFAREKYSGNQLAVFIDLKQQLTSNDMLQITREINYSESTFIRTIENDGSYGVRIFTTEHEVPFARHPTLGTAFIIYKKIMLNSVNPIVLRLKKGNIPVEINCYEKINENRFTMKQSQPDFGAIYSAEKISKALNISMEMLDISMPIQEINTGLPYLIIFWKDLKSIEKITLNANNVEQFLKNEKLFKSNNPRGLTTSIFFITKETTEIQNNYHTRMFVLEGSSIWEDAATGSANGCLLAYLLKYNNPIQSVIVEQGYEMKRKSILYLEESLKKNEYSLKVGGRIVPICEGTWAI